MITHANVDCDHQLHYGFQPRGLNALTNQPLDIVWIPGSRIKNGIKEYVDMPTNILGTKAEDKASGFKGTIVNITLHTSGCIHAMIQPPGITKTGAMIEAADFDIRRLVGPSIPKLTEKEIKEDEKKRPSPIHVGRITYK